MIFLAFLVSWSANEWKLRKEFSIIYTIEFATFRFALALLLWWLGISLFGATDLGDPTIYFILGIIASAAYVALLLTRRKMGLARAPKIQNPKIIQSE